jgi:hypothetical protein
MRKESGLQRDQSDRAGATENPQANAAFALQAPLSVPLKRTALDDAGGVWRLGSNNFGPLGTAASTCCRIQDD